MRNRRRLFLAAVLAMTLASAQTRAQTDSRSASTYQDSVHGLTVDQLVSMALGRSKRLAAVRAQIGVARGERQQVALRANPIIEANQSEQIGGSDRRTGVGLTWPLELFRVPARRTVGDEQIALASLEAQAMEWEITSRVRRESGRVMAAIRTLEVTEQQAIAARSLRDLVAASANAGAVPRLDRDIAEVDLRRLEAAVRIAEGEVGSALALLKGVLGINQSEAIRLRPIETEVVAVTSVTETMLAAQPAERPDVAVANAQLRLLSAQTMSARQEGRWDLDLTAGYMRTNMSFPQRGLLQDGATAPIAGRFHELSFGAMVTIPWRNGNQGAIAAAVAREAAATANREAIGLEGAAELTASRARWTAGREATVQYRNVLLVLAQQNVDIVQQTYLAGRGTLNEVIAERRRLLDIELTYANVLADVLAADADLRRAMGVIR